LFDALGSQCSQCGRRFPPDDEGKKKKTAHMDWHFKVNQRIAETEKRGQHRSWFVDEQVGRPASAITSMGVLTDDTGLGQLA
jgi:pre-mRNA cleavage complex 2 protein Pcf11